MKYKTVREGEQAVVLNYLGEGRLLVGPARVFLFRERFHRLQRYTASQDEYLVIKFKSGHIKHKRGPCEMYCNILEHEHIQTFKCDKIDANHSIVVYKKLKDNSVERRIIEGPTVFMPEAEEWLHEFKWHGQDPDQIGRMIVGRNKFTQLTYKPDQFYYNVLGVRTIDDTMLTVKLMLFYELDDVIKMLDTTHDPISDMINAVCADVIAFAGKLTFEKFQKATQLLGDLETFTQLTQRASRIGYTISKVVYRGYGASDQLQIMQDDAIQSRTQLRLNAELQEQEHRLRDFQLKKEQERTKQKQDMENNKSAHRQKLEVLKQEHQMALKDREHTMQLNREDLKSRTKLESDKSQDEEDVKYLKDLHTLGVDMTTYLISTLPPTIHEEIRVTK
ncbi:unnamed protein product [Owenia fusiformis]|uniref:Band 7 domain-containing protein n=1 Tax=Owenia fusiformis TaxID=6347 RepID=A0A8S4PXZ2_OWEFU|nr:unnamed protein product [Owenia fusiformis]